MTQLVVLEVADRVAKVTLNRPHTLNAWTSELELLEVLNAIGDDPGVRSVVITTSRWRS